MLRDEMQIAKIKYSALLAGGIIGFAFSRFLKKKLGV